MTPAAAAACGSILSMAPPQSQRGPQRGGTSSRRKKKRRPALVLNPDLLGLVAGTFSATFILLIDYLRGGTTAGLTFQVVIGAGLTFVVSYVAVGVFVWYLRAVRDRELVTEQEHTHLTEEQTQTVAPASMTAPGAATPQETGEGG